MSPVLSLLVYLLGISAALGVPLRSQVPSVASFEASGGTFQLSPHVQIVVDENYAHYGTPSLLDFAKTFQQDLKEVVKYVNSVSLSMSSDTSSSTGIGASTITLTLDTSLRYSLYNGDATGEGYDFRINRDAYIIEASAPIGVWWGTRTLLQQATLQLAQGAETVSFPMGHGSDSPGWEVRGFMLDAGRHWFESSFLGQCTCNQKVATYAQRDHAPQEISASMPLSLS